ncbi:heterokaryon incompatibility protein-domain-containing protein [Diplogelasinospora grovesii]|uniref:Heterokaryon incompatibility protein-domain-containing protein n=1 Tax=Diplogelasinospora grovesii TaxID=303347 RepID=A0AAN6N4F8_9PEZI|nr:heterokaryon incompatibility protein-domain-containing protein [Diplogelasinospora grovesii]
MRLLNTSSLKLKEFVGLNIPPYAILSHTWGEEEVLFDDIQKGIASSKNGYGKLAGCCQKAAKDGFEWVWIDTCCIDKTSSAELSEAINSMYQWYEKSTICYAYLWDVAAEHTASAFAITDFSQSRWFTRGWTLQELIAPQVVEFYTSEWLEIGTKGSLASQISTITGIPVRILRGESPPSTCCIAERMSWASARQTTREEDLAYCLLGIFGVHMPLLYGEGAKSFVRLQEQILKQEEDYSIFAWTLQHDCGQALTGFLASSPSDFTNVAPQNLQLPTLVGEFRYFESAGNYPSDSKYLKPYTFSSRLGGSGADVCSGEAYRVLYTKRYERLRKHDFHRSLAKDIPREPPELTSRGLRVSLPVKWPQDPESPAIAWIYCEIDDRPLCILLRPSSSTASSHLHGRHSSPWLISVDRSLLAEFAPAELYLHPNGQIGEEALLNTSRVPSSLGGSSWGRLRVVVPEMMENYTAYVISAYPTDRWSLDEFFFRAEPKVIGTVIVEFAHGGWSGLFEVHCGIVNGHPWCSIAKDLEPRLGKAVDDLSATFEHQSAQETEYFSKLSDRAAEWSDRVPGTVLSAAIRKSSATRGESSAYTLRVSACAFHQCDNWARLHVSEAEKKKS